MVSRIFSACGAQERRVFAVLQKAGPMPKSSLMAHTGLKLTTLNRFLRPLVENGLVLQAQMGESSGGRRPALYDVNERAFCLLGADISRIHTRVVLTDPKLRVLAAERFEMDGRMTPARTVQAVAESAARMAGRTGVSGRVALAGVGTVGPMSRARGALLSPAYFQAPGWKDVPLVKMMEDALGCPVSLENGANAAALAESLYGIGRGVARVVYVNCGMGIRMGTFFDGRLIRTPTNEEDVFGHMVINAEGLPCVCGRRGCLDCYASARAVAAEYARRTGTALPWKKICDEAAHGGAAADVLRAAGEVLGVALANLAGLLAPGLIILSGPLVQRSALFYETAAQAAARDPRGTACRFHRGGRLGDDAMAAGAAALALEEAMDARADIDAARLPGA